MIIIMFQCSGCVYVPRLTLMSLIKMMLVRVSVVFISIIYCLFFFFFSSRRRHTRWNCDWSSDVCSSDLEWHVKPGDAIDSDQAMVSVETDKAIVEVPAPYAGKVERLFGGPGDKIHVGAPLVGFEGAAADTGTIVGDLSTKAKPAQAKAAAAPRTEVKATPAVRALARSLNVELAGVAPTGPGGTVTTEDVKRAARGPAPAQPAAQKGMRATMARTMALAHQEVAAVTVIDDADVEHWPKGTSALGRLAQAIIAAAQAEPGLNAWYDAKADARTLREEVDLGVAVDLPDGLLVPVLRNAHRLEGEALARELDELVAKARSRSL